MVETTVRFLCEIGDRIGAAFIEEIRLFPPIRQGGVETCAAVVAASAPGDARHTVYSASYRHTLKGKERGKWESDVTAEADAPLVTLDEVVRGVMKRSGEPFEPERISGSAFRSIIGYLEPSANASAEPAPTPPESSSSATPGAVSAGDEFTT